MTENTLETKFEFVFFDDLLKLPVNCFQFFFFGGGKEKHRSNLFGARGRSSSKLAAGKLGSTISGTGTGDTGTGGGLSFF